MKVDDLFPSRFLRAGDLTRPVDVEIQGVRFEEMYSPQDRQEVKRPVLYVVNGRKGVVLTKTLARQIADLLAEDDTDRWTGRRITLYPTTVRVGNESKPAIRARAAAAAAQAQPMAEE